MIIIAIIMMFSTLIRRAVLDGEKPVTCMRVVTCRGVERRIYSFVFFSLAYTLANSKFRLARYCYIKYR